MNERRKRLLRMGMIVGALLLGLLLVSVVYAGTVTIDTFDNGDDFIFASAGSSGTYLYDGNGIIGGERDTAIWAYGNFAALQVQSNKLSLSPGDSATYTATVTWDGNDSNASSLDVTGLNSVNLISSTNDGILVSVVSKDDGAVDITFEVYTTTANWSTMTLRAPSARVESGERVDIFFSFDQFITGGGTGADFTDVGAIVMKIDGTLANAIDVGIDNIEASNAREYGDLPLSLYGESVLSATHIPGGLRLGTNCDGEDLYNSSTDAEGDDDDQADPDDEDGVEVSYGWYISDTIDDGEGYIDVTVEGCVQTNCYLNGWIDFTNDGNFDDTGLGDTNASEHILDDEPVGNGIDMTIPFTVPDTMTQGYYYARFRICENEDECNDPTTAATNIPNGEIEDYYWPLGPTAVTLGGFEATWAEDGVAVAWETTSEHDTVGFNVWRSTQADAGYVQVNDALIPSVSPGGVSGGAYAFTDQDAVPGTTYYYKLQELEVSGALNWYGPVSVTGSAPTAVTLADAGTALVWWPLAAGAATAAAAGLGFAWSRRRRR